MTAYRARLTEVDIRRLIKAADDDERAEAAHKLCRNMERAELGEEDRAAAQKILRMLANDAAELVRRAMAVTLKASDLIPNDVARKLAGDLDSIALPIIAASPAFSDEDLIEIVRAGSAVRQVAVAGRARVSRDVADVLAGEGCEQAVRVLAANDNADLSEPSLALVVERFAEAPEVLTAVAYRQVLPLQVTERLIQAGQRHRARASDQPPCGGARDRHPPGPICARAHDDRSGGSGGRQRGPGRLHDATECAPGVERLAAAARSGAGADGHVRTWSGRTWPIRPITAPG